MHTPKYTEVEPSYKTVILTYGLLQNKNCSYTCSE